MRKTLPAALAVAAVLVLGFALLGEGADRSGEGEPVVVVNFPDPQEVRVQGTPSQAELVRFEQVVLGPSSTAERPEEWRLAGSLDAGGFSWVTLSLGGLIQGTLPGPGSVAAVLVPDEGPVVRALTEDGVVLFGLEVAAALAPGEEYFAAAPVRLPVGFSRYRVYLYNTGARSVEANLYAYLGN